MKKHVILGSLLALIATGNAQNSNPWPISGNVGIGTASPSQPLEVIASHTGANGIKITQAFPSSTAQDAALHLDNSINPNGKRWALLSTGPGDAVGAGQFSIYDWYGSVDRFLIQGSTGNVGIGTTSPSLKLDLAGNSSGDDGIKFTQNGSGASGLFLNRSGGFGWNLTSVGSNFFLKSNYLGGLTTVMEVDPTYGNVGFGTPASTTTYKMELLTKPNGINDGIKITNQGGGGDPSLSLNNIGGKNFELSSQAGGAFKIRNTTNSLDCIMITPTGEVGVGTPLPSGKLDASTPGGNAIVGESYGTTGIGLKGIADGTSPASGMGIGLSAEASGAHTNYGGWFQSTGDMANSVSSYGIYSVVHNPSPTDLAGLFDGNVTINGTSVASGNTNPSSPPPAPYGLTVNGNALTTAGAWYLSDKRFKDNIKPLTSALDKMKKVTGYNYTYRTDEFKTRNFNTGNQIGFIAQELQEVFPELVNEGVDGYLAVNYQGMIPVILEAIKEQQKTIDQQAQINADLQNQLDEQKQLTNTLSQKASDATGINVIGGVDAGFQMSQNEPNPFSHETVVKYTLPPTTASAYMAVYDLTGKQITTFPISQKGDSSITITSEKLAAGIYIYSIVADGKVMGSKRMIVAGQ